MAFDVAEFRAKDYAFDMFNVCSEQHYVPGASDMLLAQVIDQAKGNTKSGNGSMANKNFISYR